MNAIQKLIAPASNSTRAPVRLQKPVKLARRPYGDSAPLPRRHSTPHKRPDTLIRGFSTSGVPSTSGLRSWSSPSVSIVGELSAGRLSRWGRPGIRASEEWEVRVHCKRALLQRGRERASTRRRKEGEKGKKNPRACGALELSVGFARVCEPAGRNRADPSSVTTRYEQLGRGATTLKSGRRRGRRGETRGNERGFVSRTMAACSGCSDDVTVGGEAAGMRALHKGKPGPSSPILGC